MQKAVSADETVKTEISDDMSLVEDESLEADFQFVDETEDDQKVDVDAEDKEKEEGQQSLL